MTVTATEMRIRRAIAALADREELPITHRQVALIAAVAARASGVGRPADPAANGFVRPVVAPGAPVEDLLTGEQVALLALLAAGLRDREVAVELGVSVKAASGRVKRLLARLGVGSRGAAVEAARGLGLLGPVEGSGGVSGGLAVVPGTVGPSGICAASGGVSVASAFGVAS